jgi:hypothetical protein
VISYICTPIQSKPAAIYLKRWVKREKVCPDGETCLRQASQQGKFICPDGEIGRRTVFRSQRSQGCAGSNPVLGTNAFHDSGGHFSFGSYASLFAKANKWKMTQPAKTGWKGFG